MQFTNDDVVPSEEFFNQKLQRWKPCSGKKNKKTFMRSTLAAYAMIHPDQKSPIIVLTTSHTEQIYLSILIKHIVGLSVCLFVCLFEIANLFRLKSERHETRHVGPLLFEFLPRSLILAKSLIFR